MTEEPSISQQERLPDITGIERRHHLSNNPTNRELSRPRRVGRFSLHNNSVGPLDE